MPWPGHRDSSQDRSDPDDSFNLAEKLSLTDLIAKLGEEQAETALRRADERGSATGALHLGLMLENRRDLSGAEAAYGRAEDRGSGEGASNLGVLLYERGQRATAEVCLRRAFDRGSPMGAFRLGVLLEDRGELSAAEATYQTAVSWGNCHAAYNLADLRLKRGDRAGALAAFEESARLADDSGLSDGARQARQRIAALNGERVPRRPPPDFDPSRNALDSLVWIAGDPADARVQRSRENVLNLAMEFEPDRLPDVAHLFDALGEHGKAEAIRRRASGLGDKVDTSEGDRLSYGRRLAEARNVALVLDRTIDTLLLSETNQVTRNALAQLRLLALMNKDKFIAQVAEIYASAYSMQELKALVEFPETAAENAMRQKQPDVEARISQATVAFLNSLTHDGTGHATS